MTETILEEFFNHNLWANLQIVDACSQLSAEQLDSEPQSATKGTIRQTLIHLVNSEYGYLSDLSGMKNPYDGRTDFSFTEMQQILHESAAGYLALVRNPANEHLNAPVHTEDGYTIEPWVLLLQAINHATEHREQIKSMISALRIKPPRIDAWVYARTKNAFIAPAK